jgi:hypothetical protein
MRHLVAALVAALIPLVAGAQSPSVLRGIVIDARTTAPVRDAQFSLISGGDTLGRAQTDTGGRFEMTLSGANLPPTAMLHARRIGYRADSMRVSPSDGVVLRLALAASSVASLPAVVVRDSNGTPSAFERRARRNAGGTFIRLADIERLKPLHTSDLLRTVAGITLDDSAGIMRVVSQRSLRRTAATPRRVAVGGDTAHVPSSDAVRCAMRVAVNGQLMDDSFSLNDVRPSDIAAIEMYVGAATIPTEFSSVQRGAPCGIVMIWTRKGRDR